MSRVPLASLCIPLYNKAQHLARTLEAVLQQTYPNLEIVISDNGSSDGSSEIAQEHARRDARIRYHRLHSTLPINESWRYCWRLAQGEFVKLHSGDDSTLAADFLERMIEPMLRQQEFDFTICETQPIIEYTDTGLDPNQFIHSFRAIAALCRELTLTPNRAQRARMLFVKSSICQQLGNIFPLVCRRSCFPDSHWRKATTPWSWPESYPDWDFLIRLFLNHRGYFVEGVLDYFHFDAGSPCNRLIVNNNLDLHENYSAILLPLTVLADPELAALRDQARPEELAQLVHFVQARIPALMDLSDEVAAFDYPNLTAKLLPRLAGYSEAYRLNSRHVLPARRLRQLRLCLAQHWLQSPPEQIAAKYAGHHGEAQRLILASGIRRAVLDVRERQLLEKTRWELSSTAPAPQSAALVLAVVLFCNLREIHDISWDWVPDWLRPDLARFGWTD